MKKIIAVFVLILHSCSASPQDYENYQVLIPEAFELANIMVALTDFGKEDDNIVRKNTAYHKEVITYFSEYENHPAIQDLNELFSGTKNDNYSEYHDFRTGSYKAKIENGELEFDSFFSFGNLFQQKKRLIQNFIDDSGYQSFYNDHLKLYENYTNEYKRLVPIENMWQWMEKEFPQRYIGYTVILSPLIGGFHNTIRPDGETVMFVNVPDKILTNEPINDFYEGRMVRIVLTEIDHNYVNPTTDLWSDEVDDALKDLSCWKQGNISYNSAYRTFNEYVTWGVFSIYLLEHYSLEVFERVNQQEVDFMVNSRGFIRFKEFNEHLLSLYKQYKAEKTIPQLYPRIIYWFESYDCSK